MRKLIGIDLGGTMIKVAAITEAGEIAAKFERPTETEKGHRHVIQRMANMAREVAGQAGWTWDQVDGVGAGIPGFFDFDTGVMLFAGNLGWLNVPVRKLLAEACGKPVEVENDANAAAIGEQWVGAGRGSRHMIFATVGTGIGGGIIVDGKIHRGANGMGGEIGHLMFDPAGEPCAGCGKAGCLETISSGPSMLKTARRLAPEYPQSAFGKRILADPDTSVKDLAEAAQAGDELAAKVWQHACFTLGRGLANLSVALNPDMIVLGGGISRAGEFLLNPTREGFRTYSPQRVFEAARLRIAVLGNDAGVLGAARLMLSEPAATAQTA